MNSLRFFLRIVSNTTILSLFVAFIVSLFLTLATSIENRRKISLASIFLATMIDPFLYGFLFIDGMTPLGSTNTVIRFTLIIFSFVILIGANKTKLKLQIESHALIVLRISIAIFFVTLMGYILMQQSLSLSYFLPLAGLILIYNLKPTESDLAYIPMISKSVLSFIFILLLMKYQSPAHSLDDSRYFANYSDSYSNRFWKYFDLKERFRGPFLHPNQAGIYVGFAFATLALNRKSFNFFFTFLTFIILAATSSRTSIVAVLAILFFLIWTYSPIKKSKVKPLINLLTFFLGSAALLILFPIISNNPSLSGRTLTWITSFNSSDFNVLYGGSSANVEGLFVSYFLRFGIIGMVCFMTISSFLLKRIKFLQKEIKRSIYVIFIYIITISISENFVRTFDFGPAFSSVMILISLANSVDSKIN